MATKTPTTTTNNTFTEKAKEGSKTVDASNYNEWNKQVQAKIDAAKAKGLDVQSDYDANGALHYTTKGADKLSSILNYYNTSSTATTSPTYSINGTTYNIKSAAQQAAEQKQAVEDAQKEAESAYADDLAAQQQAALGNLDNVYNVNASKLASIYNQQKALADADADDEARQQYILYKQSKDALGEQLSSQGITGGASETALNSILNAYSTGLATNEKARQSALTELGNTYQNDLSDLQAQLTSDKANIYNTYGTAIAQAKEAARQDAEEDAEEAAAHYEAQQKAADVAKWNESVQKKINEVNPKYTWTDDDGKLHWANTESIANTAKAMGYKVTTSSGVTSSVAEWNKSVSAKIEEVNPKYTWTDSDGKLHWSNNQSTANIAKASGYKVTTRTDKKTTSSSSSSNSTKTTSSTKDDNPFSNSSSGDSKADYNKVLKTAVAMYSINSTLGPSNAAQYIADSKLTNKEKEKAYKALGLV